MDIDNRSSNAPFAASWNRTNYLFLSESLVVVAAMAVATAVATTTAMVERQQRGGVLEGVHGDRGLS